MGITTYSTLTSNTSTHPNKMTFTAVVILALVAVAAAKPNPPPSYSAPSYHEPAYPDAHPAYKYDYAVKAEDGHYGYVDFGQNEERDGYNTYGSYYVALPDGRVQKVSYTVNGDEGYVADVTYEGEASYAPHKPAPAYKAAPSHHAPAYKPAPSYPAPHNSYSRK